VSVYSTTKFVEGHSVALGGALVTRDGALLERLRFVRKATGAIQVPLNAWLTLLGLKTLALRMERQSRTADRVARWLVDHPRVKRVWYPGLSEDASQHAIAEAQHLGGHGAVVTFELRGGLEAASAFARSVELCRLVEHVGSVETLLTHPATMTHADVPEAERRAAGISDGLLRLSVGLESPAAILDDLDQAIQKVTVGASRSVEAGGAAGSRDGGDAAEGDGRGGVPCVARG
jgi:cystathionine beta-lyase/cystathionine gamma-synthase